VRADLDVQPLTGNLDTRLRRLHEGGWEAIVVAQAGLERLGQQGQAGSVLTDERFVPAPGQGTLALEGRAEDSLAATVAQAITDQETFACLLAERALSRELGADCHTPLGALAQAAGCGCLQLRAWVGLPDGSEWLREELVGGFYDPEELGKRAGERMLQAGAGELLRRATEMALVGG
jgi:hydroxymethylbilane synthase